MSPTLVTAAAVAALTLGLGVLVGARLIEPPEPEPISIPLTTPYASSAPSPDVQVAPAAPTPTPSAARERPRGAVEQRVRRPAPVSDPPRVAPSISNTPTDAEPSTSADTKPPVTREEMEREQARRMAEDICSRWGMRC